MPDAEIDIKEVNHQLAIESLQRRIKECYGLADKHRNVAREETRLAESLETTGLQLRIELRHVLNPPPPVDRSRIQLTDGTPVPGDRSHKELKENGQQRAYVVLSPEERAKGFVRPVRRCYYHVACGSKTTMSSDLAETYARDPTFYSGTFCGHCRGHFPLFDDSTGERRHNFFWFGTLEPVGS